MHVIFGDSRRSEGPSMHRVQLLIKDAISARAMVVQWRCAVQRKQQNKIRIKMKINARGEK